MCGIWALLGEHLSHAHKAEFLKIAGRGPDLTVLVNVQPTVWLGFHRLAIVEPGNVASVQPIVCEDLSVVCNGELYNHEEVKARSIVENIQNGASDCAAIIHAFLTFKKDLRKTCASLDGVFAFIMADKHNLYIGRDPIGVRPLFYGFSNTGDVVVGSEVKSIEKLCERVLYFPPGCCATIPIASDSRTFDISQYYSIPCLADRILPINVTQNLIRQTLIASVQKRLMGNRQFGFMLSGGLDSSLVAAIASRMLKECRPIAFSVGFEDSPDIENARAVAKFLDIEHRVLIITPEQCIKIIPEVIYALETFDPFIVRCGVAHYLLCKHIATTSEVKVLLSGEGADELFGSYAYMQRAPSAAHLHREILRRLKMLHHYDVLRCDRATSCHGLEIRVPFLDKKFIDLVVRLPASYKISPDKIEKHVLRSAFTSWLPDDVLWRSKEGFSEALGKIDLGDVVEEHVDKMISEQQFELRGKLFPIRTPETKEEFWYRMLFDNIYSFEKIESTVHTKVYRTAAWHLSEEKENVEVPTERSTAAKLRRRSTGSATLTGVVA